jgi:hypothetical protein
MSRAEDFSKDIGIARGEFSIDRPRLGVYTQIRNRDRRKREFLFIRNIGVETTYNFI